MAHRQQVGKGEAGRTSDQEWHFTVYTSGEERKEASKQAPELLTYQAPEMLRRFGDSHIKCVNLNRLFVDFLRRTVVPPIAVGLLK